jgi:hypothetical protein
VIERLAVLAVVVGFSLVALWVWERRPTRRVASTLGPGLVLVTSRGCPLCPAAITALQRTRVPHRVVDTAAVPEIGIRSVPTLLALAHDGTVVQRRSGRAAITDAPKAGSWVST